MEVRDGVVCVPPVAIRSALFCVICPNGGFGAAVVDRFSVLLILFNHKFLGEKLYESLLENFYIKTIIS